MNNNRKFSHINIIDTIATVGFTVLLAVTIVNAIKFGIVFEV